MSIEGLILLNFGLILTCIILTCIIFIFIVNRKRELRKIEVNKTDLEMSKLEFMESFIGGIEHDFNNYLSAIIGNINFAKTYVNPDDELFEILDDADKSSVQALGFIKQFSVFSKSRSCDIELKKIQSIIKDTANSILQGSKVIYRFILPDDLWRVAVDEFKICTVFRNLIINSKEAIPNGGEIIIHGENVHIKKNNSYKLKPGKYVYISIQDSGTGIPKEIQLKVFNPFFTTKIKHSGLGLAISHSIILNHKGYINFKSKDEDGSIFHIYLRSSL